MITDLAIDQALIELKRTEKALLALRAARRGALKAGEVGCTPVQGTWDYYSQHTEHATAKRASMDLTRKLADLRAGR